MLILGDEGLETCGIYRIYLNEEADSEEEDLFTFRPFARLLSDYEMEMMELNPNGYYLVVSTGVHSNIRLKKLSDDKIDQFELATLSEVNTEIMLDKCQRSCQE